MAFDRFDMEQQIMSCWGITDEIGAVVEGVTTSELSPEDAVTVLMGLKTLYNLKFDKLFREFEAGVHEGKIKNEL